MLLSFMKFLPTFEISVYQHKPVKAKIVVALDAGLHIRNNRTLDIGSSGMTAVNLLIDGGIEKSTDSWTSSCSANASAAAKNYYHKR